MVAAAYGPKVMVKAYACYWCYKAYRKTRRNTGGIVAAVLLAFILWWAANLPRPEAMVPVTPIELSSSSVTEVM